MTAKLTTEDLYITSEPHRMREELAGMWSADNTLAAKRLGILVIRCPDRMAVLSISHINCG